MTSRHRTAVVLLILLTLLLSACDQDAPIPTPTDGVEVTISQVIDGDTVELDDGRRVRYLGINTPEQGRPFYDEATSANRRLVEGKSAWLVLDVQPTDQYGRTLAYVWVGDQFVNVELVRQGYAAAYTDPPNVRYSEAIIAAEKKARETEVGLWAPSDAPLKLQEIHFDAPGPDGENPNGEWVEIVNEGSKVMNLVGFTLKDEATHIYTFPDVTLEPNHVLKLYSGQGTDGADALFWGLVGDAGWNNNGDTAFLRDRRGRLVDMYRY
jgi:endonuclease YncB( thermonuclease family)